MSSCSDAAWKNVKAVLMPCVVLYMHLKNYYSKIRPYQISLHNLQELRDNLIVFQSRTSGICLKILFSPVCVNRKLRHFFKFQREELEHPYNIAGKWYSMTVFVISSTCELTVIFIPRLC